MSDKGANNENSKGEKVDCEMCEKLEKYKILYQAYADEIKNLWQRSIFLGALITLAWGGYGALQLNFIENGKNGNFFIDMYHCASIGLCAVIIVLSLLWVAMAKGSKFVQEAHEKHIENLNFDEVKKMSQKDSNTERLFCKLSKFDGSITTNTSSNLTIDSNPNLFRSGVLKPCRYSPSRINIALGWLSCFLGCLLISYHIGFYASYIVIKLFKCNNDICCYVSYGITALIMLILTFLLFRVHSVIKNELKGEK